MPLYQSMLRGTTRIEISGPLQRPALHSWQITDAIRVSLLEGCRTWADGLCLPHLAFPWFRIPAPECSLSAWSNLTALSVGDALFLSKSPGQESPSLPFSCFAALNWYYISILDF